MDSIFKITRVLNDKHQLNQTRKSVADQKQAKDNFAARITAKPTPTEPHQSSQPAAFSTKSILNSSQPLNTQQKDSQQIIRDTHIPLGNIQATKVAGSDQDDSPKESSTLVAEQHKLDELRKQASDEGFKAGYEAGLKNGEAELHKKGLALDALCKRINQEWGDGVHNIESAVVEIVYTSMLKILGQELAQANTQIELIKHTLQQVQDRTKLTVRLAQKDYDLLAQTHLLDKSQFPETESIQFIADSRIELGGCIIETGAGHLDARLEVQLQHFKEMLLDVNKSNEHA